MLADTAGRLPTQLHLMEEIKKVKRVIAKADPSAPHEVLLVLDANTGQNALAQVKAFDEALGVTGLVLTKLDGTAKGGVVAAIARAAPDPGALHRRRRRHRRPAAVRRRASSSTRCSTEPRRCAPRDHASATSRKRYPGGYEALRDVSFAIEAGDLACRHRPLGRRQEHRCSS